MSPSGNGPTLTPNEVNHNFQIFSKDDESLENSIEFLNKIRSLRKDKVCVVSVIGKSCLSANNCKTSLVDQMIGKNVFRVLFFDSTNCPTRRFLWLLNNIELKSI